MAERRMFAKTIIDSDAFLDMPLSAQALYFHLSMRADDEGFINNPKKIQRMILASDDDMRVLLAKNFIIHFESGVIVIKHWKIHNYIRGDRLIETTYQDEKAMLSIKDNGAYTLSEIISENELSEEISSDEKRKKAYKESSLPYSFSYKMKRAFEGITCPVCGKKMTSAYRERTPSVQHNIPISKGGEHELENISMVCNGCNSSIRDKETDRLNNTMVVDLWDKVVFADKHNIDWFQNPRILDNLECRSSDSQVTVNCPSSDSIGKDSIVKDSIVEDSIDNTICSEPNDSEPVITLTLNDKSEYPITQDMIDEYQELYPAVDVMQELRNMKGWCNSNPTRRKTKNGIKRFINSWLAKEQDKGFTPMPNKKQRVDEWSKA